MLLFADPFLVAVAGSGYRAIVSTFLPVGDQSILCPWGLQTVGRRVSHHVPVGPADPRATGRPVNRDGP